MHSRMMRLASTSIAIRQIPRKIIRIDEGPSSLDCSAARKHRRIIGVLIEDDTMDSGAGFSEVSLNYGGTAPESVCRHYCHGFAVHTPAITIDGRLIQRFGVIIGNHLA